MTTPIDALYEQIPVEVLDDLTAACKGMKDEDQAGATKLLLYMLLKRSARRREQAKGPVKPAKLKKDKWEKLGD